MIIVFTGVPLAISSLAGLVVAVIQSATQIQEQTITHLVKFATISVVLYGISTWFAQDLIEFVQQTLGSMVPLGSL